MEESERKRNITRIQELRETSRDFEFIENERFIQTCGDRIVKTIHKIHRNLFNITGMVFYLTIVRIRENVFLRTMTVLILEK